MARSVVYGAAVLLDAGNNKWTNLADGVAADDAATVGQIGTGGGGIGATELIYRYTVTGSDKASIDTGVDTPDAGTNVWSGGDLLEIWFQARTDEAVTRSGLIVTLNNDGSSIYDLQYNESVNVSLGGGHVLASAGWNAFAVHGASASAGEAGVIELRIPNFAGTTFNKHGWGSSLVASQTAATALIDVYSLQYRSTSAITRFAVIPATSAKKFKVGSQLLIYKRLAS